MTTATDTALADVQIAFIGAGVMAESMISGLLDKGIVGTGQVVASHPRADRRQRLRERHGSERSRPMSRPFRRRTSCSSRSSRRSFRR